MIISHKSPYRDARANELRAKNINAGFNWSGSVFDIDPDSFRLIMSRAVRLTINPEIQQVEWRTKDNAMHLFSRAQFLEFAVDADAHVESLYQASWQQKQ